MKFMYMLSVISFIGMLMGAHESASAEPLVPYGVYSSKKSADGEHWGGWEIRTWMQDSKLVGFVALAEGLIGDQITGKFENLKFDKSTGNLSFSAYFINAKLKVYFSGTLWPDHVVGSFILDNGNVERDVILARCCDDAPLFKRFESYEEMAQVYELQPNPSFKRDALKRAP